jgi:FixJ family two-component response regulator
MNEEGKPVVAIVDDDRRVLESLEHLLESGGYRTRTFLSARAFLESDTLLSICCLISDVCMPQMTGLELEERAHLARPELPVILITGNDEALMKAESRGDDDHHRVLLRKPLDGSMLLTAVGAALAK